MADRLVFKNEEQVVLGKVDGDVKIENCRTVVPEKGSEIIISGNLDIEGPTTVKASVRCNRLDVDSRDEVVIEGDLVVTTSVEVERGSLLVEGSVKAEGLSINGSLKIGKDLECTSVHSGGAFKVEGNAKVERIDAGGAVAIGGKIEAKELRAGGSVKCNTGTIEDVDVGGVFKATGPMEINEFEVGGVAVLGPGSKILSGDVGGTFKSLGELTFEELEIGGAAKFEGNATGKSIQLGGSIKVEGSLTLSEELEANGSVKISKDLHVGKSLEVNGVVKAEGEIVCPIMEVGGAIRAARITADKEFYARRGSRIKGIVQAGKVEMGRGSRADSIYGETIRIERRSRVKNLYGREIYLERDVRVEGDLLYTGKLETERDVHLEREPKKVDKLPSPEKETR